MIGTLSESLMRRHSVEDIEGPGFYRFLFDTTGYGYVLAWGISFYPQLMLNWRRKSTAGMSIGFQWYNLLGFSLYLVYTSFVPECTFQDQLFAGHALFITACSLIQVPLYGTNKLGDFPRLHGKIVGAMLMVLDVCLMMNVARFMTMTELLYACGYIKTAISLVKYTPQLYLNWQRKSVVGFAMGMVFLDLSGGLLSIAQQLVECQYDPTAGALRSAWSWDPVFGNKPKFLLGMISIAYDLAFMYQYFVLFPPISLESMPTSDTPLAASGSSQDTHQLSDAEKMKLKMEERRGKLEGQAAPAAEAGGS